jgi:hypothetical protein
MNSAEATGYYLHTDNAKKIGILVISWTSRKSQPSFDRNLKHRIQIDQLRKKNIR